MTDVHATNLNVNALETNPHDDRAWGHQTLCIHTHCAERRVGTCYVSQATDRSTLFKERLPLCSAYDATAVYLMHACDRSTWVLMSDRHIKLGAPRSTHVCSANQAPAQPIVLLTAAAAQYGFRTAHSTAQPTHAIRRIMANNEAAVDKRLVALLDGGKHLATATSDNVWKP